MIDVEEDILHDSEQGNRSRIWVHPINLKREEFGEFHTLYEDLRNNEKRFFEYFRMSTACFDEILGLIQADIEKQHTSYRAPISPAERLMITLRFLATGDSCKTIACSFRVGSSTMRGIIVDVCDSIWNRLQPIYMSEPTQEMWENSVRGFQENWNFPNCIGAIDGKHVTIKRPKNSGSRYFNYLKKYSVVLLAIVSADYKFMCVDIGGFGRNCDGGIFGASIMSDRLEETNLNVPPNKCLPNSSTTAPFVIIGDEAFPLRPYLMRPFPQREARHDSRKSKYNEKLGNARRVVENAFGILTQKWRIFLRPIDLKVDSVNKIIKAACVLHNYLRTKGSSQQFGDEEEHIEENVQIPLNNTEDVETDSTSEAFRVREIFADYFGNIN